MLSRPCLVAAVLCISAVPGAAAATVGGGGGQKPNLIMILQDDLGWYDVGFHNNSDNLNVTGNITRLAREEGIVLDQHYVFYWCSPTRRSFLTGRLPLHHHELLSDIGSDDIVLRPS